MRGARRRVFISMVDDWMLRFVMFGCIYSLEEVWWTPFGMFRPVILCFNVDFKY